MFCVAGTTTNGKSYGVRPTHSLDIIYRAEKDQLPTTMKLLITIVALVSSVRAFAPVIQQSTKSTALSAIAPQKEIGVLPPFGFFE